MEAGRAEERKMSRISYSEDEDFPGQFELWRHNLERSLKGKAGQLALRDLEAALLTLPEKKLIGRKLVSGDAVCATGALVALRRERKGMTRAEALAQMQTEIAPGCSVCWHPKAAHGPLGCSVCPKVLRQYLDGETTWRSTPPVMCPGYEPAPEYEDEDDEGTDEIARAEGVPGMVTWAIVEQNDDLEGYHARHDETDEARYDRVLKWVRSQLVS